MAKTTDKEAKQPDIQLIANVVVRRGDEVLLVRHDPGDEVWWLPGGDLQPYEHPDDAAKRVLADIPGLKISAPKMVNVESFRGRRGWHVMFNYLVDAAGEPKGNISATWHKAAKLPRTKHGNWEQSTIAAVLSAK